MKWQSIFFLLILFDGVLFLPSCTTTQKIESGEMAMEYKQYYLATQMLKDEMQNVNYAEAKARKAFYIGRSESKIGNWSDALYWYEKAFDYGYGKEALFQSCEALLRLERYEAAQNLFRQLYREEPTNERFRKALVRVRLVRQRLREPDRDTIEIVNWAQNSPHRDFSLGVYGGKIYFTSDRRQNKGEELYKWTGQKFMDIYQTPLNSSVEPKPVDIPINTEHHEADITFHPNETEIVFTRCGASQQHYDFYCQLYSSAKVDGRWTEPRPLPFLLPEVNYMHPAFSANGNTLYFSSDHPDNIGEQDLWQVSYSDLEWGQPQNMGSRINTQGREVYPTLDGDTLYFSSDYRVGFGGLDIFKTYNHPRLGWLPPEPLPHPINSGGDDMSYIPVRNQGAKQSGYFVSSRPSSEGSDDIYLFSRSPFQPDTLLTEQKYNIALEVRVKGEAYKEPNNPNSGVIDRKALSDAQIDIVVDSDIRTAKTNFRGAHEFPIKPNKSYFIMASADGFLNKSTTFSSLGLSGDENEVYIAEIVLPKKVLDTEIILENIYYDFDKSEIRPDAALVLDTLSQLLSDNPKLKIQLNSHTDCRGEANYNQTLSQDRAQSAVNYLIKKGIARSRLSAKGYGEDRPFVDCLCDLCSEDEHQKNRRTSFTILNEGF
ncbi:MAG: OmpA family protein [Bacteroidetes bacterium]|jgi:outer membrane protein OmpA-like peptidoglycan-associated protein|nr:OmpA family protein [Bacteroidota bacterium]